MRTAICLLLTFGAAVAADIAITPVSRLELKNVSAEAVTYKGKKAVRVSDAAKTELPDGQRLAIIKVTEFSNGTIEFDLAGDRLPGAGEGAKGFSGLAFRVTDNGARYEAFYLRPYNGRIDDQVMRNHSVQYISIPEWGWRKLREQFPKKYETYADLVPGEWTHVKIEVKGDKARLYVGGASQPTLIVNDLKHGASGKGALALWIDPATVAHFANLKMTP